VRNRLAKRELAFRAGVLVIEYLGSSTTSLVNTLLVGSSDSASISISTSGSISSGANVEMQSLELNTDSLRTAEQIDFFRIQNF
jgi:hypothetical protein